MDNLTIPKTFPLLDLPREIRYQILGEVLFPGEEQPTEGFTQDHLGLAPTAVRQIFPYDTDEKRKPKFDVAIIRTCMQLQEEAEAILYGTSSWNLMYQDWSDGVKLSYEFFEKMPRRLRRLIQRVERKCYSRPYYNTISLHDWTIFMTFLSRECPNLHSLKLWGPGDTSEGPQWVESCQKEEGWVQAILQIESLEYFDIPVIKEGVIYQYPEFKDDFLPWLKTCLVQAPKWHRIDHLEPAYRSNNGDGSFFPFLKLDRSIRDRIYRHALLPQSKRVHPYLKSWYDLTTRNVVPLFLACKKLHEEAMIVLYSEAVFTSPLSKYDEQLDRFLESKKKYPHYFSLIKHIRITKPALEYRGFLNNKTLRLISETMNLDSLEIILSTQEITDLNREWTDVRSGRKDVMAWGYVTHNNLARLARLNRIAFDTTRSNVPLDSCCEEWLVRGMKQEMLYPSGDPQLQWLHVANEQNNHLATSNGLEDSLKTRPNDGIFVIYGDSDAYLELDSDSE